MAGAHHIARLELEIRHGVSARSVAQQQIAVHLVGLGPDRLAAHEDVADPDRVGMSPRQGALVDDVARAVRLLMLDENALLEVLLALGQENAEQLGAPAGTGVMHRRQQSHRPAPEGDRAGGESGVAADRRGNVRDESMCLGPVNDDEQGEVRSICNIDDDCTRDVSAGVCFDDDLRRAERTCIDLDMLVGEFGTRIESDDDWVDEIRVSRHVHRDGRLRSGSSNRCRTVCRYPG